MQIKLKELEEKSLNENLWNDREEAESILKEKTRIENTLNEYNDITSSFEYNKELLELSSEDEDMLNEIYNDLKVIEEKTEDLKLELIFKNPEDKMDCFLEINAGVGGVDACDFASMLYEMYIRWANLHKYKVEIINYQEDDVAGITNAIIKISGENVFGKLKNENGVHRIVRISPYNANGKRETSFASVYTYPVVDNSINIEILEKDLKIDTYRSSGAGGQHINKTESAVRITHIPTKIVVQCQTQRSQFQNKDEAMKMLKSKLFELEREKQQEKKDLMNSSKTSNGWGQQIRSYVLHPYQMVKDLRSNYEISDVDVMFNGEKLDGFIKSLL